MLETNTMLAQSLFMLRPAPSTALTLSSAGGVCVATQIILNTDWLPMSWFWRQSSGIVQALPASFQYALNGGPWLSGLPSGPNLSAGAIDTLTVQMPCDGGVYVLSLADDLGHLVNFQLRVAGVARA
jgi:hypothetical protein